jgi:GntR family transcriptional regulator / MocR family aminotransferase
MAPYIAGMELHISLVGRNDVGGEIYRQVRRAILEGQLRPGDPLPPSRELARQLTVSRTTVTGAYDRLAGEGFVTARVGAGTVVSEQLALSQSRPKNSRVGDSLRARPIWDKIALPTVFAPSPRFEFRCGLCDASLFPHDTWRRLMARQLRSEAKGTIVYDIPAGNRRLREAIVRHIGISRGVETSADDMARNRRWMSSHGCCCHPGITSPWKTPAIVRRDGHLRRSACAFAAFRSTARASTSTPFRSRRAPST